jgi:hypothetical protein
MTDWNADRTAAELEEYWNHHSPFHEQFTPAKATQLALFMVRRYEAALCRIARTSPQEKPVVMEALGLLNDDQLESFERLLRNGAAV